MSSTAIFGICESQTGQHGNTRHLGNAPSERELMHGIRQGRLTLRYGGFCFRFISHSALGYMFLQKPTSVRENNSHIELRYQRLHVPSVLIILGIGPLNLESYVVGHAVYIAVCFWRVIRQLAAPIAGRQVFVHVKSTEVFNKHGVQSTGTNSP